MHEKLKIFPSIPWLPPEKPEGLPTSLTSVFLDKDLASLMDFPIVTRLIQQFNPNQERHGQSDDIKRVKYNFKMSFLIADLIKNRIEAEKERGRLESSEEIDRLAELKRSLDTPSPYSSVRMRFEKHTIENKKEYQRGRKNLIEEAKRVFKKGGKEYFLF